MEFVKEQEYGRLSVFSGFAAFVVVAGLVTLSGKPVAYTNRIGCVAVEQWGEYLSCEKFDGVAMENRFAGRFETIETLKQIPAHRSRL